MRKRLTKMAVDGAKYEGQQYPDGSWSRCIIWDTDVPGFGVRVVPSGKKFFIFNYRVGRRTRLIALGDYGTTTVQEARDEAERLRTDTRSGARDADPLEQRKQLRDRATMADLCQEYMQRHARPHKRSWEKDQQRIDRHILPRWGSRQAATLTRAEVADLHRAIGEGARYEANRTLALLSKMLELGVDWGFLEEGSPNPAKRIRKYSEVKRDRWVTHEELPRLAAAIDAEPNLYARAALWLFLLLGCRKNELLKARWADLDFDRRELRIPEEHAKTGQAQVVPLSPEAVAMFKEIPRLQDNPHLFPSPLKAGAHIVNIDKAWRRVRKAAGVEDVRLHDLRRTVGSWLAQSGNSLLLIQKALGHRTPAATTVYARLGDDPVRKAMESHSRQMMAVAGKREPAEIVDLEEARANQKR